MTFDRYLEVLKTVDDNKEIVIDAGTKDEKVINKYSDMESALKLLDNTNIKNITVRDTKEQEEKS